MPRQLPRYPVEANASRESVQRAFNDVSLDVDSLTSSLSAVPYSPGNPSDWSGTPPANLQAALDRIAAAIGPIP